MAKINVNLAAFYGYGCGFQSYGSKETIEVEISEIELDALKNIGKDKISSDDVVALIEAGDTSLEPLHDQLSEAFYNMVEEYWLFEAYNECLYMCLQEHIEQDINDGLYTPVLLENDEDDDDMEELEDEELDDEDEEYEDDEDDYEDYEDDYEDGCSYDLEKYYEWVKEHDHEFIAERVGLDLDACRDDEVNYTISLDK